MKQTNLTDKQKRADTDLWVILLVTLFAFGVYVLFQDWFSRFVQDGSVPVLLRTLAGAAMQFGVAGLGITIVSVYRKERFRVHGLQRRGALRSVVLCILCFVPYLLFIWSVQGFTGYLPFQTVWTTKALLAGGFPVNVLGLAVTAVAWGFFEGFNYVVICDKINERYPPRNRWLNGGAITCAVLCILIHGMIGVTPAGIVEMLTVLFTVYGMLLVREFTGNAWGCVFLFLFFWNAF